LLTDRGHSEISWLDPDRPMRSINDDDLEPAYGYLWDLGGSGNSEPFTGGAFTHIRGLVASTPGCHLVIVLDDASQVPPDAGSMRVDLGAPDPIVIAEGVISRSPGIDCDAALTALHAELAELVIVGTPPEKAHYAAKLAVRVAAGELDPATAQREFHEGLDRDLAHLVDEQWSSMEYTMLCAVALLQDEPFEDVIKAQRDLDDRVRESELPAGKSLRPRRKFIRPNDRLLAAIGATTEYRDNPSHPGLRIRTVRFVRSSWADVALSRIWQNYHVDHRLLMDWMCDPLMVVGHFSSAVRTLTALIRHVPNRNRLGPLDILVTLGGAARWHVAAAAVARLEKTDDLGEIARETLDEWFTGTPHRKCAAIVYHSRRFDLDPEDAMAKLTEIARDKSVSVHDVVVGTFLRHLMEPDHRDLVLRSMVSWLEDKRSLRKHDGLPSVALDIGRCALHLTNDRLVEKLLLKPLTLVSDYPNECRRLVRGILLDPKYGQEALQIMNRDATLYRYFAHEATSQADMERWARLLELLAPGLGIRQCRQLRSLIRMHQPEFTSEFRRIIRAARRAHLRHPSG
jgi:hypothetical protein